MEKRSPNFTSTEVDFLLAAVKKYSSVIENKKTDRVGAEEKTNAWRNIEREFNSKFTHTFRNHKVLKTKYGNIKATAKQNFAFDKQQPYATGGGPPQQKIATKTDHSVLDICQEAQILGKSSSYDCDADENDCADIEFLSNDVLDEHVGEVCGKLENTETPEKKDDFGTSWARYTPKMLKKPLSKSLYQRKEKTKESWEKVAEAKMERQKLEMEFLKEKHSLEIEKIKLEIELIRIQINNLKKVQ